MTDFRDFRQILETRSDSKYEKGKEKSLLTAPGIIISANIDNKEDEEF